MSGKHCFREANGKGALAGFGALEALAFAITFMSWSQCVGRPLRGLLFAGAVALVLRLMRRGRLPGMGAALAGFFWHGRLFVVGGGEAITPLEVRDAPYVRHEV